MGYKGICRVGALPKVLAGLFQSDANQKGL